MSFLKVKLTNPTGQRRAYAWFPGGLSLPAYGSRIVSFDPFSRIDPARGMLPTAKKDVLLGRIVLEYKIDAPCRAVDHFTDAPAVEAVAAVDAAQKEAPEKKVEQIGGGFMDVKGPRNDGSDVLTIDSPLEDLIVTVAQPVKYNTVDAEAQAALADNVTVAGLQIQKKDPVVEAEPSAPPVAPVAEEPKKKTRKGKNTF